MGLPGGQGWRGGGDEASTVVRPPWWAAVRRGDRIDQKGSSSSGPNRSSWGSVSVLRAGSIKGSISAS